MNKPMPVALLDEIDEECRTHGLPPLSWLVVDVPGRPNATREQIAQVHAAAAEGKYDLLESTGGIQ
jgi:hypothetical protein